jgi:dihydrolipoamide dehydrogenase
MWILFNKSKIEIHQFEDGLEFDNGEIVIGDTRIACDGVINASLRKGVLPESNLDLAVENGFLSVDAYLRTNYESIYAVGDVNGKSIFAHAASAQGLHAVNTINGGTEPMNFSRIPFNMYTYPEMAQVGAGEPELKRDGIDYKVSEFPLSANGKALTEGHSDGLVRILSDKKYGEVLGVQVIADHATDMIAEAASIMQIEGTIFDVAATVHAHPTVSEIFMEAGFAAFDQPIHK